MQYLAFDIETVPDVVTGRRLHSMEQESDADVAAAMFRKRREKVGNDFLPHHLQRIVAISAVYRDALQDRFSIWSLGNSGSDEADLVTKFFAGIDRYTPTIVSWNGSGFDLPVLHYRGLLHGVSAQTYWDMGEDNRDFKWNNYIGRFHLRHVDLMDVLAGYNNRAFAPLEEIALMLGLPGKMGMSGAYVWDQFQAGEIAAIRNYCETDALNTALVYLHWQKLRGQLNDGQMGRELDVVENFLKASEQDHWKEFDRLWSRS